MPLTWVFGLLLFSYFTRKEKWKKKAFWTGLLLLFVFSNEFLANEAMLAWEVPPTPMTEVKNYEVGIVLTGVTNYNKEPRDRVYFVKGADRATHAMQLYFAGKIKKILITGGKATIVDYGHTAESINLKGLMVMCGIPEKDIIVESEANNTRENATLSAVILNKAYPHTKHLLITSAFHMRRSKGCFDKAGLDTDEFSVDFYSHERKFLPVELLLPSEAAISKWGILVHEIMGYVVYKVVGYC